MLNLELIDSLYASLPSDQQKQLITLLFKRSKQTMAYFRRTKDISLSKLETLADFFHMPLDYFRAGSSFKTNNISGNNNFVGNVTVNSNLMVENEMLRSKVISMEATIEAKNETIKAKDDLISSKNEENIELKAKLKMLSTNQ